MNTSLQRVLAEIRLALIRLGGRPIEPKPDKEDKPKAKMSWEDPDEAL